MQKLIAIIVAATFAGVTFNTVAATEKKGKTKPAATKPSTSTTTPIVNTNTNRAAGVLVPDNAPKPNVDRTKPAK